MAYQFHINLTAILGGTSLIAISYNFVHARLIKATSATTTTVIGQCKIVGLVVLSAALLGMSHVQSPFIASFPLHFPYLLDSIQKLACYCRRANRDTCMAKNVRKKVSYMMPRAYLKVLYGPLAVKRTTLAVPIYYTPNKACFPS